MINELLVYATKHAIIKKPLSLRFVYVDHSNDYSRRNVFANMASHPGLKAGAIWIKAPDTLYTGQELQALNDRNIFFP